MRHCHSYLLPIFAFLATAASAAHAQILRKAPASDAVDAIFKRYDRKDTPGCSVAVIDAGKVAFKKSYGMAEPALGVPMSSGTTSWIPYSEARVFVALAVAMLAKDGKIALDDPIRRHVPQVPAYAAAVTVRHLSHHTSGLADYGVLAGPSFELHDRLSDDEFFRTLSRWDALGSAPGKGQMYSNTDYALLKILVESVSGDSLHNYLSEKLLKPQGMSATRIGFDQSRVVLGHALFHEAEGDGFRKLLRYRVSPVGGIAVTTSLDDLVRFNQALLSPNLGLGALLKQLELGGLAPEPGADGEGYAFGVFRRTHQGLPLVEYHGVGEFTYLVQVPNAGLSVATLCNAYAGMDSFAADVARLYVGSAASESAASRVPAERRAPPALKPAAAVDVTMAELQSYVGEYRDSAGSVSVDVTVVEDTLAIRPRGRPNFPALKSLGNGKFETLFDGAQFVLQFKAVDGDIILTSWDMTTNEPGGPVLRRWVSWQPSVDQVRGYPGTYVGDKVRDTLHVRVDGGRVLMAGSGFAETALTPQDKADQFRLPEVYTARFERDGRGRVLALILDASRVKGMRFTRQD